MLPIYDKFLSTPDIIDYKSTFGHIKFFNESHNLNAQFVDHTNDPCLIFFYAGNQREEHVDDVLVQQVLDLVLANDKNILVLDSIIEDFVNPPFCDFLEKIMEKISADRIKIITSFNPANRFADTFFKDRKHLIDCNFEIFSYDGFSSSFVAHQIRAERTPPAINERKVEKHFSLMQKNARFLRKLVHAYFIYKKYNEKSLYAWHSKGIDRDWTDDDKFALIYLNIPIQFDEYITPINYDNEWREDEWKLHDDVFKTALNIVVETTAWRDDPDSFFGDTKQHEHNYFLSEKTYKNFWYGLPYLHLGIPHMDDRLHDLGYKTFADLFDVQKRRVKVNAEGLKRDFHLIDHIANMSLDDLMDILNSPKALGYYNHNRKMLQRLLPLKNILNDLDKY